MMGSKEGSYGVPMGFLWGQKKRTKGGFLWGSYGSKGGFKREPLRFPLILVPPLMTNFTKKMKCVSLEKQPSYFPENR